MSQNSLNQIDTLRDIGHLLIAVSNRCKASGKRRSDNPLKVVAKEIFRFAKVLESNEILGSDLAIILVESYLINLTKDRGYLERFLLDRREYLDTELKAVESMMEVMEMSIK